MSELLAKHALKWRKLKWQLAAVGAGLLVLAVLPVSNTATRTLPLVMLSSAWAGGMVVSWSRLTTRLISLTATVSVFTFLCLPARNHPDPNSLRQDYVVALRRYERVRYFWGGEWFTGIDCSGLVRRGLVDTALVRGIRSADPGLFRVAAWLWWHDCATADLGKGKDGLTTLRFETQSVNALDHSRLSSPRRGDRTDFSRAWNFVIPAADEAIAGGLPRRH